MPIDQSQLAQIQWDDEPAQQKPMEIDIVGGVPESKANQPIDLTQVVWDDERPDPKQSNPANDSDFARMISGQPKPEESGIGRDLAFGARSVLQGAGSLLGAVGGDAFNNYIANPIARSVGAQEARPYREEAAALADRLGLPRAQTATDRVLGDVGEALTGTGLTMGVGAGINALANLGRSAAAPVTNRLADLLTAQPVQQTIASATGSAASGATREAGGGTGAQLAAGLAGGIGPSALATLGAAGTRGLVRGASGEQMQRTIADFNALGATPSVGQASGNRAIQGVENLLAGAPTSSGVMNRFAERQAEQIGQGLQGTGNSLSRNASAERAGRAIETGVETFSNNVRAMRQALYWQADQFMPANTPVSLQNTQSALQQLVTPTPGAVATTGALVNPKIQQMAKNLSADLQANGGAIPYEAVKELRSRIGEALSDFTLTPDSATREYRKLYAALSQDLERAAKQMGPEAEQAARRANNYTRVSSDRLEQIQRVVDKNGGPEQVYNAVMQGTKDGGTTLRAVMQSLPEQGQKAVTAAVIKRMGMANPGAQDAAGDVFSAATFLTNWNKVSPEARRALFDRYGSGFSQSMDRIARVADNIKQGAKVYANPSGTANRAAAIGYGVSLGGSILHAMMSGSLIAPLLPIGGGAAANWMARKLTHPDFVNWLAHTTTVPVGSAVGALNGLKQMAERKKDPELMDAYEVLSKDYVDDQANNARNQ